MLHTIWDVPTVERVFNACRDGIKDINIIVVVGIKAMDVMKVLVKENVLHMLTRNSRMEQVMLFRLLLKK